MMDLVAVKPEQEVILKVCLAKINELFAIVEMYRPGEDKLFTRLALKNSAQSLHALITNGKLGIPPNAQTMANKPQEEGMVPNEPSVNPDAQPNNESGNCDAA